MINFNDETGLQYESIRFAEQIVQAREQGKFEQAQAMAGVKTLRDEFAIAALTALIARDSDEVLQAIKDSGFDPIKVQAETAYKIANAMMAERARQAKGE